MIPARLKGRLDAAPEQFHRNDEVTQLEVDADSLIYKVAATTKDLEVAKRRLVSEALSLHFLADADFTRLHLTPKHCRKANRFNIVATKPYQGQRKNAKKPELVEPLRYVIGREQLVLPPELSIVFNAVYEADDSVVMACTENRKSIFYSEDKDLDCLCNRKLCQHEAVVLPAVDGLGWLSMKEMASSKKVIGRGPVFFWAQMLMGDTADNIAGITKANGKLCGPKATYDLLSGFLNVVVDADSVVDMYSPAPCKVTEDVIARYVLSLYKANEQNPWPEAWLLWLYRTEKYSFYAHLQTLGLLDDSELGLWLKAQAREKWFIKDGE